MDNVIVMKSGLPTIYEPFFSPSSVYLSFPFFPVTIILPPSFLSISSYLSVPLSLPLFLHRLLGGQSLVEWTLDQLLLLLLGTTTSRRESDKYHSFLSSSHSVSFRTNLVMNSLSSSECFANLVRFLWSENGIPVYGFPPSGLSLSLWSLSLSLWSLSLIHSRTVRSSDLVNLQFTLFGKRTSVLWFILLLPSYFFNEIFSLIIVLVTLGCLIQWLFHDYTVFHFLNQAQQLEREKQEHGREGGRERRVKQGRGGLLREILPSHLSRILKIILLLNLRWFMFLSLSLSLSLSFSLLNLKQPLQVTHIVVKRITQSCSFPFPDWLIRDLSFKLLLLPCHYRCIRSVVESCVEKEGCGDWEVTFFRVTKREREWEREFDARVSCVLSVWCLILFWVGK